MTFGLTNFTSIVNKYPIVGQLVPDSTVRSIDNARMLFEFAAQTERDALATANRVIEAHNAGLLTRNDYANYDAFRHKTYDTQVRWLRQIRSQLYALPGGSIYANRIPWPGWLPALRPETPRTVPTVRGITSASELSGLGAAPVLGLPLIAGIALLVVVGLLAAFVVDRFSSGAQTWMILKAQSSAIDNSIEARRDAFTACVQAGTNAETCAQQVRNAIPAPSQAAIDAFVRQSTGKGVAYYVGVVTIVAAVVGLGWWGYRQGWWGSRPSGTRGLASPTRLKTLKDKVPSRYGLEV